MASGEGGPDWKDTAKWLWDNKDWVLAELNRLRSKLFGKGKTPEECRVLVIGPGGVGKTTTARLLSGDFDSLLDIPGPYQESLLLESFALRDDPGVELIVPPGQAHRRDATWTTIQSDIAAGKFRGVILISSFGFHSLGEISYKQHRLYQGDPAKFFSEYLAERRADELAVLKSLAPFLKSSPRKIWMLNLVTKQDLWWSQQAIVERHYREGDYGRLVTSIGAGLGHANLRVEFVFASLVISNFVTGAGEQLAATEGGYDGRLQVNSIKRFWETLDALQRWEES